mmetsp:Transcript_128273/g.251272  ORF Transcript_128273/g.251272 Transcript_128273/m.251272 type:complete len:451 (-) Transcript_128273:18-1370(-)
MGNRRLRSASGACADHLVHAIDHVLHVALVQTSEGDPPGLEQVDVVLADEPLALGLREARIGEHPDLVGDVVPRARGALLLEALPQHAADLEDSVRHALELGLPRREARGVTEDALHQQRAVDRRAGVHRPDDHLQLREHGLGGVGARADDVQHADALAVEAQVLREGLAQVHVEAHGGEEPRREGVLVEGSRSVALVGAVHQGHKLLLHHDFRDLTPLVLRRVHARRVVRASVQQDVRPGRGLLLQRLVHAIEVEATRLRVVIGVGLHLQAGLLEDGVVVAPGRVRDPDGVRLRAEEALDELARHPQGAGARQRLHRGDAALRDGGAVLAEGELLRQTLEPRRAVDGAVLLVDRTAGLLQDLLLSLPHAVEHEGFPRFGPVGADAEVDLPRVRVGVVGEARAEDGVRRGDGDMVEQAHASENGWASAGRREPIAASAAGQFSLCALSKT